MATKIGQELTALGFNQEMTKLASGQMGYDTKGLDLFVKTAEAYERELKRVFGSIVTTISEIDKITGQGKRTTFIPKQYEQEAIGVIKSVAEQRKSFDDNKIMYNTTESAHYLETVRDIKGAKAQQYAKEELLSVGGIIKHTPGTANKDSMTSYVPVLDSDITSMSRGEVSRYVNKLTPLANRASTAEQRARNLADLDSKYEYNAKHKKFVDKENARRTEESERAYEQAERTRIKQEEQKNKEAEVSKKAMIGKITRIGAILITIADISRRILTATLAFGSQVSKETTQARTLNMSYGDLRNLNYIDKALGLKEGTSLQAQEDLRKKFGNTANLDTEALKWLAMVMGDEVGQMVQSGLGGENPAKLMERILDDFFKRQQEGRDQYGNFVGQDKARRALVTLLESVSPDIARVFERMVEEQTSGLNAGGVTSYRQMQALFLPSSGGLNSNDWEKIALLGKEADSLKATFANLGETIKGSLLLAIQDVVEWADNLHIGETGTEQFERDSADRDFLRDKRDKLTSANAERRAKLQKFASKYGIASGTSIEDIIKFAGYDTNYAGLSDSEVTFIKNSKEAIEAIVDNDEMANVLLLYLGAQAQISEATKQINSSNPNAKKSYFSDAGLASEGALQFSTYIDPLGYSGAHAFNFEESNFSSAFRSKVSGAGYPSLFAYLQQEGFGFGDIAEGYQEMVARAGISYLTDMQFYTEEDKKTKAGKKRWETYQSALSKAGVSAEAVSDMLARYKRGELNYGDVDFDTLMAIYTSIISPNATNKVKKGGIGASNEGAEFAKLFLTEGSDIYGLNKQEWEDIKLAKARLANQQASSVYAGQIASRQYDYTQGSTAGTININVRTFDQNGNLLNQQVTTVQGTLAKDFSETVNTGNENTGM